VRTPERVEKEKRGRKDKGQGSQKKRRERVVGEKIERKAKMAGVMRKAKVPGSKTGARAKAVGTKRKAKVAGTKRKAKERQVSRQMRTTSGITEQKVAKEANPSTAKEQKERAILLMAKARAKLTGEARGMTVGIPRWGGEARGMHGKTGAMRTLGMIGMIGMVMMIGTHADHETTATRRLIMIGEVVGIGIGEVNPMVHQHRQFANVHFVKAGRSTANLRESGKGLVSVRCSPASSLTLQAVRGSSLLPVGCTKSSKIARNWTC